MRLPSLHASCATAFTVTALLAWVAFYMIGDYNMYVGDVYGDGRAWVKSRATQSDRVLLSLGLAVVFAAVNSAILWLFGKISPKKNGNAQLSNCNDPGGDDRIPY